MKQGFELIKSREYNYESEIATMEKDFSLTLPPLFKLFATYFELGSCCTEKYLAKSENSYYPLEIPYYPNNENVEWDFYNIEDVFEHHHTLMGYGDEDIENGFLRIAAVSIGGSIFVGINGENIDKIILSLWDKFPLYEVLSNNIFEFIQKFKQKPIPEEYLINTKFSQLYKNWGEDFWRVKEV